MLDLVSLKVDYIESWDTGSCVSNEHGANDCVSDRYQLCAQNKLSSKEAWMFIWCNFKYQSCLSYDSPQSGLPSTCTLEGVMEGCLDYTKYPGGYEAIKQCAASDESAAWAKASANRTTAAGSPPPQWVYVDGKAVTDDSYGNDHWGATVLTAICKAAEAKNLQLPQACSTANVTAPPLVAPIRTPHCKW